jgi:hypothetical protein
MLTFATAEPMYHFAKNLATIQTLTEPSNLGNVRDACIWSFTHWGFAAWAAYAIVGLSLGCCSYRRGLPLTIRSGLTPLFDKWMSGPLGHVVAVVATVLGVPQTLGFGVEQFVSGLSRVFHRGHHRCAGGDHGCVHPVGALGRRQGHQVALEHQHGPELLCAGLPRHLRLHAGWLAGAVPGHVGLRDLDPRQPARCMDQRRHTGG